jgi:hypothetical protein
MKMMFETYQAALKMKEFVKDKLPPSLELRRLSNLILIKFIKKMTPALLERGFLDFIYRATSFSRTWIRLGAAWDYQSIMTRVLRILVFYFFIKKWVGR